MKEETGFFTSFDRTNLFFRAWEKKTPNVLIMVHGFGEHSGRYHELASALEELPLSIFIHDLRGHGQSQGERVYVDKFEDLVEDLYQFRAFILARTPHADRKFILLGQSFGGLVAAAAALRSQAEWRALILLSPFFGMPLGHGPLNWLSRVLNWLSPRIVLSNPIRPVFLTHDQEEVTRYKRDEWIQRRITFRMASEMFKGCASAWSCVNQLSLPFLLLASGDDHIVSTRKAREFFEAAPSGAKEMRIFPGFYHELLHEVNRQEPITVIKDYLIRLGL